MKLHVLCETRWVERHTSFTDFQQLYEPLLHSLETIHRVNGWDTKSVTDASGLLNQITSSNFIAAFQTCRYLFGFTKGLSILLQGSTMDLIRAYNEINLICEEFKDMREKSTKEFHVVYEEMNKMSTIAKEDLRLPRRCAKQTLRNNLETNNIEDYYRQSLHPKFRLNIS